MTIYVVGFLSSFNEGENYAITEVTGIVKRGEKENILRKRKNWPLHGIYQWIDLHFICRFFKVFNDDSAEIAYIERMVPNYEEGEESLYPVPATKENFFKGNDTPDSHLNWAKVWGATSVLSALSTLLVALRR